ncbi:MAG TPA: TonB-dependent receptor, partial [Opitutaceae bacterium]
MTHQKYQYAKLLAALSALTLAQSAAQAQAQTQPADSAPPARNVPVTTDDSSPVKSDDESIVLSPFEVSASKDSGYIGSTTLAGSRLNSDVRDLGTSVSVYSSVFLKDINATDNQTLLKYTLGTEVGGINGNFAGAGGGAVLDDSKSYISPDSTNRVRGLAAADDTRDLFLTSIPWDGYNVDGVDIQRGPNSILFGQGSPAGIINTRLKQAEFKDLNEVSVRFDQWGGVRGNLDVNRVLLKGQLAIRFDYVDNNGKFEQRQAFDDNHREFAALRWEPDFLKKAGSRTIVKLNGEIGRGDSNRPRDLPPVDRITPWFTSLGQQLYNPVWANDNQTFPGRGVSVANNPNYNPWIGSGGNTTNFGGIYFGGPIYNFNGDSPNSILTQVNLPYQTLGLAPDGTVDKNITGLGNAQPHSIAAWYDYARLANLPLYTLAKDKMITDPNIFDFYHNLLEGPNKSEWMHFYNYNASLTQTFFNDSIGFDAIYNKEHFLSGNETPFGGGQLFLDFDSTLGDGTNTPGNYLTDGTANPGAGRPYIYGGPGGGQNTTDREDARVTAFATHDFSQGHDNIFMRALGRQTITGLYTHDKRSDASQSWTGAALGGDYINLPMFNSIKSTYGRFWADFVPHETVYLGPSLTNASLSSGLHIPAPTAIVKPTSGT